MSKNPQMGYNKLTERVSHLVTRFFKYTEAQQIESDIKNSNNCGMTAICNIIENNSLAIKKVVELIYEGWSLGSQIKNPHYVIDIDDCVNTACICLMENLAPKLNLTASVGEIVSIMCLWMEQKVKREILKEKGHAEGLVITRKKVTEEDLIGLNEEEKKDVRGYAAVSKRFIIKGFQEEEKDISYFTEKLMSKSSIFNPSNIDFPRYELPSHKRYHKYYTRKGMENAEALMRLAMSRR